MDQYVCPTTVYSSGGGAAAALMALIMEFIRQSLAKKEYCYPQDHSSNLKDGDSFDFVVIGSGSGGATVANRLTENPHVRVLMVEAGGYPSVNSDIPSLCLLLQKTPEDWQYLTEPSPYNCLGFKNKQCRWPRGKALGGSSTINVMIHVRGNKLDYDTWCELGNYGWDYETMLEYYKKSETILEPKAAKTGLYGTKGPLYAEIYDNNEPVINITKAAAQELGLGFYDTQPLSGYFQTLSAIKNGVRYTSAKAYVSGVKERSNLFLAMNTLAIKIVINPETNFAQGVQLNVSGKIITVKATREVILSAGAVNSPQLLMLSGVGPREHLEEMGIPVIQDLPVGKNLQDHPMFLGVSVNISDELTRPKVPEEQVKEYLTNRTGTFSQANLLNFMSFMNIWNVSDYPDLQFHHFLFDKMDVTSFALSLGLFDQNDETDQQELMYVTKSTILKFVPTLLNMTSRGEIKLKSKDPLEKPAIYPNYYTDSFDYDINTMLKGIRFVQRLMSTKSFSDFNATLLKPAILGCDTFQYDSDEYWKCGVRHTSTTIYHPAGTCKMGPENDPGAVVNPELQVYGVAKLRVIDASIMPKVISANTHGATVAIGEKGADLIKKFWFI